MEPGNSHEMYQSGSGNWESRFWCPKTMHAKALLYLHSLGSGAFQTRMWYIKFLGIVVPGAVKNVGSND
jgi:hypothetical protein